MKIIGEGECREATTIFIKKLEDEKSHYLGQFNTAEEAAKAYDAASLELHGKYGHRNFS
ncbi:AP2 domain-containing protein [Escherichia coli]